jgi:gluconokinase
MRGRVIFVIGVAGCGKSTVAGALAEKVGGVFLEGDEYHSPQNVATMAAGHALTDDMRWGWLGDLAAAADAAANTGGDVLVACSGLKRAYRDVLRHGSGPCRFIFLDGDKATILARMALRTDHYMPTSLLDSQFETLEPPQSDETDVETISILHAPDAVIATAERSLNLGE